MVGRTVTVRLLLVTCLILLVVLFALTVWPTPYRYEHDRFYQLIRFHRITGVAEHFDSYRGNWLPYANGGD